MTVSKKQILTSESDLYFISPIPTDVNSIFYCLNRAGIAMNLSRDFYVERTKLTPYSQIFCTLSGSGNYTYRGKSCSYGTGDICVMRSREPHSYSNESDENMAVVWMEFYGANSDELVEKILEQSGPVFQSTAFNQIANRIGELVKKVQCSPYRQPSLEIYEILLELIRCGETAETALISPDITRNLSLLAAYIDTHMGESISNQTLADLCGMSLSYFNKSFRQLYRMTPQQYIMHSRLTTAKYILTETDESLESISERLGFCNTGHFVRNFRLETGLTPARYRKQYTYIHGKNIRG